jgi:chromosomal replication initiation ATPase DnaA
MQMPLPLVHMAADDERNFLVSEANRAAVTYVEAWPDWPQPVALVTGPEGCGKTHLARIFARRSGAVVFDDLDRVRDEEALFHAWNAAAGGGVPLLLLARTLPSQWNVTLRDLRSRLMATPQLSIEAPDDALLAGIMIKQFRDRGLMVDPGVLDFVLARIERSFSACAEAVGRLDAASLSARRNVTVPLAREVLGLASDRAPPSR